MALRRIQQALASLYDLEVTDCVEDFVCDAALVEAVGQEPGRGEVLLIAQDEEGVAVGLYVCPDALARLGREEHADHWFDDEAFGAASLATEGVSHFVYLMFRASNEEAVSELELELQAEVDKYATALLSGNGVGAIRARSRSLRVALFRRARFLDAEDTVRGSRYRLASRVAEQYARRLEDRFLRVGDVEGLLRELRLFYRRGLEGKLESAG